MSVVIAGCDDSKTSKSQGGGSRREELDRDAIPVNLGVLRDGGTIQIQVYGGAKAGGWDLYRAASEDPSIDGRWFKELSWRKGGGVPLGTEEVLQKMEDLEKILSQYFPDGLYLVRAERKKLNNLTSGEMSEYTRDPKLNFKLDTHSILQEIDDFRYALER